MRVYRLSKREFIDDLSGEGARLYGGRWNSQGQRMLYTAENRSLATVEYLVHLPFALIPRDIFLAGIELPDHWRIPTIDKKELPADWDSYPAPGALASWGDRWLAEEETPAVRVPSVIVKGEFNVLLNPVHPEFSSVLLAETEEYRFDRRLVRKS